MTFAPQSILDARTFLLAELDMHPGEVPADLDPDEVGIVGDSAHLGGYHCGRDRTVSGDYSVIESSRDKAGLSLAASALDVGLFDRAGVTLVTFSLWLVDQCRAGTPDTQDIREVIYSPDGKTVKRWDRLGRRSSGDSSHLIHTHISYFRDSEGRSKRPLFERFIEEVFDVSDSGLIANAERAATALYTGMDPVPMPSPWNDEAKAGFPNPLVRLERKLDDLAQAVAAGQVAPTDAQWAALTAAIAEKVGQAVAAALGPDALRQAAFEGAQRAERE